MDYLSRRVDVSISPELEYRRVRVRSDLRVRAEVGLTKRNSVFYSNLRYREEDNIEGYCRIFECKCKKQDYMRDRCNAMIIIYRGEKKCACLVRTARGRGWMSYRKR